MAKTGKIPILKSNDKLLNYEDIGSSPGKSTPKQNISSESLKETKPVDSLELIKGAMVKFDKFWSDILQKYEKVTNSSMNPNVPDFEKLFKSLSKPEKKNFKPFLKILAHSLQFLDKMMSLDTKLEGLKKELKASLESQDQEKIKMLETQIINLQKNCKDFITSEDVMKRQIQYLQEKNKELDNDMDKAAHEILEYKKQIAALKSENSQLNNTISEMNLSNDLETVKEERDHIKTKISDLINEVQEKENTIEEMVLKINDLKEIEMKYLDMNEEKQHLLKQIMDKEKDIEVNKLSLDNLQNALKEQQEGFEWTINDLEKEKAELEETVKRLEEEKGNMQVKEQVPVLDDGRIEMLEKANTQLSDDINQVILQKEQLAKELETAKDSLKSQELNKGNMVRLLEFKLL